jgi:hypothetical protein
MPLVMVGVELEQRVEQLRGEVSAYLERQGVVEQPLVPGERSSTVVYGGFDTAPFALELSTRLRRGIEEIVGRGGLKRLAISVHEGVPDGTRLARPQHVRGDHATLG